MTDEHIIELGEKYIQKHGYGIVPSKDERDRWKHTGFRIMLEIEKEIGRKITDKEWEDMSIR